MSRGEGGSTIDATKDDILSQLVRLSNHLGDASCDYVILGEGNTSANADDGSFWVKASGAPLGTARREHFVRVSFPRILSLLDGDDLGDEQVRRALTEAKLDPDVAAMPSVETFMHAVCLQLDGVKFIGHTHPTAINTITCSQRFEEALAGRLFPDEIVVCGPAPVLVPYTDPGLPLARAIRRHIEDHLRAHDERPRAIYLQNHGFVALGATAGQVEDITAMAVKAARILVGTHGLGGPSFLTPQAAARIHRRPDEHYRQRILGQR
jgi:rhamnose utilization protein RhaD (predicted bifunctional aldolase and dehydrogenase)